PSSRSFHGYLSLRLRSGNDLVQQLLSQAGTRRRDAEIVCQFQTKMQILVEDEARMGSEGELGPLVRDPALGQAVVYDLFQNRRVEARFDAHLHPYVSRHHVDRDDDLVSQLGAHAVAELAHVLDLGSRRFEERATFL